MFEARELERDRERGMGVSDGDLSRTAAAAG